MKKTFLSAFLGCFLLLCLIPLLSGSAHAADTQSAQQVTINTITLDAEHPYYKNGDTYGTAQDHNAYFDAQTGTLTIKDLEVKADRCDGITTEGDLILILQGESTIKVRNKNTDEGEHKYFYGIDAVNLTIRGTGSVYITYYTEGAHSGGGPDCGIRARDLTIESGDITVYYSYRNGISASNLRISGGTVNASSAGGIYVSTEYAQTGGSVTAYGHLYGLSASRFLCSGGELTLSAGNADAGALSVINTVNLSGGRVTAAGHDFGIRADALYLTGGAISATADRGCGIECDGPICLIGGDAEVSGSQYWGALSQAPTFSSCCTYAIRQGSDAASAVSVTTAGVNAASQYIYCDTVTSAHSAEPVASIAPTCTEMGQTEGSRCTGCGLYLKAPFTLYTIPHSYTEENPDGKFLKSSATCKAAAVYYRSCTCGAFSTYSSGTFSYGAPLPHTPETVTGTAPTCTAAGRTDGSRCSVCKTVLTQQQTVPATGHSYTEPAFAWSSDLTGASASASCHCSHTETVECTLTWDDTVPGCLTVTASAALGDDSFTDSLTITASEADGVIAVTLPEVCGEVGIIAAAYDGSGRMIGCEVPEIDGNAAAVTLIGGEIRIFFLTKTYHALCPAMILCTAG